MNVVPGVVGIAAVAGLLIAWTAPRAVTPLFLLVGVPLNAYAVIRGLVLFGAPGFLLLMLAVPYWLLWIALYTLGGLRRRGDTSARGGRNRSGPAGDGGTLGTR